MPRVNIRHAEPGDYEAMHRIMSGPRAAAGTLQLPLQPAEAWRKRLADPPEGLFVLVACVDDEVVGNLGLETFPSRPRVRHSATIGMAVRDDWQGKGVGTELMRAALERWSILRAGFQSARDPKYTSIPQRLRDRDSLTTRDGAGK